MTTACGTQRSHWKQWRLEFSQFRCWYSYTSFTRWNWRATNKVFPSPVQVVRRESQGGNWRSGQIRTWKARTQALLAEARTQTLLAEFPATPLSEWSDGLDLWIENEKTYLLPVINYSRQILGLPLQWNKFSLLLGNLQVGNKTDSQTSTWNVRFLFARIRCTFTTSTALLEEIVIMRIVHMMYMNIVFFTDLWCLCLNWSKHAFEENKLRLILLAKIFVSLYASLVLDRFMSFHCSFSFSSYVFVLALV